MTETSSHTDEAGADDHSIPPPGIEVVGELPPGTPWWDAERLAFRWKLGTHIRFMVPAIVMGIAVVVLFRDAGVLTWVPLIGGSAEHGGFQLGPALGVLSFVGLLCLWIIFGTPLFKYLSINGNTVAQGTYVKQSNINYKLLPRFSPKMIELELAASRLKAIDLKIGGPANWEEATFSDTEIIITQSENMLDRAELLIRPNAIAGERESGFGFVDHWSLLTYRIAKAKGKNPPPPEGL